MVDKNNLEVVRMKKVLVIGSAVVDVVIHLPHLPEKSEDVHVTSQKMSLGGCAYNASDTIRHFKVPVPFSRWKSPASFWIVSQYKLSGTG